MIHLFKTCMITAFILGLTWSAPLRVPRFDNVCTHTKPLKGYKAEIV